MPPLNPGEMSHRLQFQSRGTVDDGYGNSQSDFAGQFTVWAKIEPKFGGESVMAARLAGTQPAVITVRASDDTAQVTNDWRAIDQKSGEIWNIHVANLTADRAYVELLAERGVAT